MGSDIAELLLRERHTVGACDGDGGQSDVGSLIDINETQKSGMDSFNTSDLLTGNPLSSEETSGQNIQNYTKLLLAGRKKVISLFFCGVFWFLLCFWLLLCYNTVCIKQSDTIVHKINFI